MDHAVKVRSWPAFCIETFSHCHGTIWVTAPIEDPVVTRKILGHLEKRTKFIPPPPDSARRTSLAR